MGVLATLTPADQTFGNTDRPPPSDNTDQPATTPTGLTTNSSHLFTPLRLFQEKFSPPSRVPEKLLRCRLRFTGSSPLRSPPPAHGNKCRGVTCTRGKVVTSAVVAPSPVAGGCCGHRRPPRQVDTQPRREEDRGGRCRAFSVARGRRGGALPPPLSHRGGVAAVVAKKKKGGREAMVARWASGQAGVAAGFTCYPRRPTSPSAPSSSRRSRRRSHGSATKTSLEW